MIQGWACPVCKRKSDLMHYESGPCAEHVHPDYARAVYNDANKPERRGRIGVSDLTGCPRKKAIMESEEVFVNPLAYNAMTTGTAWHALLEKHANPALVEIEVSGVIDSVPVTGHIDRIRESDHGLTIDDHKHVNEFRRKYLKEASAEYIIQTSVYAELYEQQTKGVRPVRGCNWYHFTGNRDNESPFVPLSYSLWPLAQCLEYRPYGGTYSVREILHQLADFTSESVQWADLPLVGETIAFGNKTMCDPYCEVRDVCWMQAKGAPF